MYSQYARVCGYLCECVYVCVCVYVRECGRACVYFVRALRRISMEKILRFINTWILLLPNNPLQFERDDLS